jgi:hypothetical protein
LVVEVEVVIQQHRLLVVEAAVVAQEDIEKQNNLLLPILRVL